MSSETDNSIQRFSLPNGLKVVHKYDPSTAMVAVDILYNTGARDEKPAQTGIAHLFEHLMFGGSANVKDFDRILQDAGGTSNAWTSNDFTNFYEIIPSQNIETAFYLESDRMLALDFSESSLDIQRNVVIEEFKERILNQPYGLISHYLRAAIYGKHPYSWPVIGKEISHIESVRLNDIRDWFYTHYAPNNAILAVCGNVKFETIRELSHKWFGSIPSRSVSERPKYEFSDRDVIEYKEVRADVPQPMITIAFPMPAYGKSGYVECDAITDILASGKASRFYRNLINDPRTSGLFAQADASITGSEDTGLLLLNAILTDNTDAAIKRAVDLLNNEITRLSRPTDKGGVSPRELERIANRHETQQRLQFLSPIASVADLAQDEFHNETPSFRIKQRQHLTPNDIRHQIENLTTGPSTTIAYRPNLETVRQ